MKRFPSLIIALLLSISVLMPGVMAQQADADLIFESAKSQAGFSEEFIVTVKLKNPGNQSVIAVRSWLEYDPKALEVISIDTSSSAFSLAAPGEDKAEPNEKVIKIGRSNIQGGANESESIVAMIRFKVNTQSPTVTSIKPHNYQVNESGHTTVNIIDAGFPLNILSQKPDILYITLNGGPQETGGGIDLSNQNNIPYQPIETLQRPQNLRLNIGDSNAELRWDMGLEPQLKGYYVYYGKTSGFYTRRMDVGLTNQAFFDDMENGQIYYFAVTAYDTFAKETDYSDEVAGIIGQPGSSTAPFEDILSQLLAKIPSQPENGPMAWWLFVLSTIAAGIWLKRKKRNTYKI